MAQSLISIHAPRTGSDGGSAQQQHSKQRFQSTLPARGATPLFPPLRDALSDFNPRSPHGERRTFDYVERNASVFQSTLPARGATLLDERFNNKLFIISIHAPRTGSDRAMFEQAKRGGKFQSTLPARGATAKIRLSGTSTHISIHAPRTGSDCLLYNFVLRFVHFNPRSPHGERPPPFISRFANKPFQSTLPARGATLFRDSVRNVAFFISIHAPRTGSDSLLLVPIRRGSQFQSTLPARGATFWRSTSKRHGSFQSTLPARGATLTE